MTTPITQQPQQQQSQQQQSPRPVLRRATYVHVSDLTSAYNIDHTKLEEELSRVKRERENEEHQSKPIETTESEADVAGSSVDVDQALAAGPQKRLQPPRGGYNLCV